MTPERTHSYRRVVKTLEELGPSKLQAGEQAMIRDAADTLIFCGGLDSDSGARGSLQEIAELCDGLVASGRWTEPTAAGLLKDVAGCGPPERLALQAA